MRSLSDIVRDLDLALEAADREYTRTSEYRLKLDQLHEMIKRLRKAFDDLVACLESMSSLHS